jgi:hypothetical protein
MGDLCRVHNGQLECKWEIYVQFVTDSWTVKRRFMYSYN